MGLEITEKPLNLDVMSVKIAGDIDIYTSTELKERFEEIVQNGHAQLVVNLEGVPFVDCSGLGALLHVLKTLRQRGGNMVLVSSSDFFLKILDLTGLNRIFKVFPGEEEAVAGLANPLSHCLDCALFVGISNCPTVKSLAYPAEPCSTGARLPWLCAAFREKSPGSAEERKKKLSPIRC